MSDAILEETRQARLWLGTHDLCSGCGFMVRTEGHVCFLKPGTHMPGAYKFYDEAVELRGYAWWCATLFFSFFFLEVAAFVTLLLYATHLGLPKAFMYF